MANQEQLAILKQGVEAWNNWRSKDQTLQIDLSGAYLAGAILNRINLDKADLSQADLRGAQLKDASLIGSNLGRTDLYGAFLVGTYLRGADLSRTNLGGSTLNGADFTDAYVMATVFVSIDLSQTIGLEAIHHVSSSPVSTETLQLSQGKIPLEFLRGCGLSDFEIEYAKLYNPNLSNQEINDILYKIYDLRARQAIQVSPLFISYSHANKDFVDRLEIDLNERGVRFWRDVHNATAGRLETQIEQAIRHNPTVLLVLSQHSLQSDWVEHEVRTARKLEKELARDVLCPVALDDAWKSARWPQRLMEQVMEYNILDFSRWRDEQVFAPTFVKLLDGLQLFYKK